MAVGDGNHSLATAKAYWEELKPTLPPAARETHPARWCLAELVNIHSPALLVEPIHRVAFGISAPELAREFCAFAAAHGAVRWESAANVPVPGSAAGASASGSAAPAGAAGCQTFCFVGPGGEETIRLQNAPWPLAVGTADAFFTQLAAQRPGVRIDYVHGAQHVRALAGPDTAGLLLPDFAKSDLFCGVALGGVLPKKTFSMGHAEEKRYYLECRAL